MPLIGSSQRRATVTGRTLHLYGPFDAELAIEVFKIPEAERLAIRTLDLSDVEHIFADGALLLVADYLRHEKLLRLRCEGRAHVSRALSLHGWDTLLTTGTPSANVAVPQRVRQFSSMNQIDEFVTAAVRSVMTRVRCAKDVLKSFEWSLSEVIGNVFTHSQSRTGGLVQTLKMQSANMVRFSVVDTGVGLRKTLTQRYGVQPNDVAAIRLAIQKGVTRDNDVGQGWGLFGTSQIAAASGGYLSIWTGAGRMVIHSNGHADFHEVPLFQGTAIDFALRYDRPLSLQTAIDAVYDPDSIVFLNYERERGICSVRMTEHASAFSDRAIGRKLRMVVLNVLVQPGNEKCVVDFANVRIVASSFADEFLGKLALSMGNGFEEKIRLMNISPDNQRIVGTAIATRRASG